ncbi:MAG: phosphocholine cytidylyltransferase family protein [Lachnospiraceae bacterium]|nr:phosphocholine cytidylyltransferase family protein [Lachnospiraceae bacterium]
MKAILLAAGKGSRISRMVQEIPKSTLPINGVPLIQRNVDMLQKKGLETVVCVGYQQDVIRKALQDYDVTYYFNPFYGVTNSIASLWFARQELEGDCLILNADVFFSEDILEMIMAERHPAVMLVDKSRRKTGDYFFATTDNGCIKEYGKDLPLQYRSCEYVGIAKISSDFMPVFTNRLDQLIKESRHDLWWENTLYSFTNENEHEIHTKDVEGSFWSEIDYFDDYERILNYLSSQKEKKS